MLFLSHKIGSCLDGVLSSISWCDHVGRKYDRRRQNGSLKQWSCLCGTLHDLVKMVLHNLTLFEASFNIETNILCWLIHRHGFIFCFKNISLNGSVELVHHRTLCWSNCSNFWWLWDFTSKSVQIIFKGKIELRWPFSLVKLKESHVRGTLDLIWRHGRSLSDLTWGNLDWLRSLSHLIDDSWFKNDLLSTISNAHLWNLHPSVQGCHLLSWRDVEMRTRWSQSSGTNHKRWSMCKTKLLTLSHIHHDFYVFNILKFKLIIKWK